MTYTTNIPESEQETLRVVIRAMAAQGWSRSYDPHRRQCRYLIPLSGLRCPAGHLLEHDSTQLPFLPTETRSWHSLVAHGVVPNTHEQLISTMQSIHDLNDGPQEIRLAFHELSREYKAWPSDVASPLPPGYNAMQFDNIHHWAKHEGFPDMMGDELVRFAATHYFYVVLANMCVMYIPKGDVLPL